MIHYSFKQCKLCFFILSSSIHLSLSSFPDFKVRVEWIENKQLCSSASRRGKFRQEVTVASGSTRAVAFVIIPMTEGRHQIEVKASVKGLSTSDGVKKFLLVVVRQTLLVWFCCSAEVQTLKLEKYNVVTYL